jgi:PrtD family type I secretion system ABC transporter
MRRGGAVGTIGVNLMQNSSAAAKGEISRILRASRGTFVATWIFSALVNILMLTGPLFMLQVYDRVLTSRSVPTLLALSAIVVVLYAYYGFLEFVRSRILIRISRRIDEKLRDRAFDTVVTHALRRTPNFGNQPVNDLATIRQYLGGQGPFAFLDMPWVPVYLAVIFLMHWVLGVAALAAAALIFVLAILTEQSTRKPLAEATSALARATVMTDESRRNSEALQALGMRERMRERWDVLQQEALDHHTRASDSGGTLSALSRVIRLAIQSGVLALGAYLAIRQEISPGSMIAASIIMSRALAPVEQAVANWQQFLGFRKAMERLSLALQSVPPEPERMKLPRPAGRLDVENLIVQLPNTEKPVLQGVSFTVTPGRGLGVIGPTGAGKSTLARTLVGVQAPTRGTIRLDGATLDQRGETERGRLIGYLPQDVQLFDGTVAQNISRFDAEPDPEMVVAAARLANVHDLVMRLPQGYDTPLGENGARLSAGQRQRMALARALYGDPVLFVLDEPNSNLDAEGEAALDRAIRASMARGAAVVVVAHRPSALVAIQDILVLSEGRTVAMGPKEEILKKVLPQQPAQTSPQPPRMTVVRPEAVGDKA